MQPAELSDHVLARAKVQVIRVTEHDLRAERAQLLRVEHLHGCLCPHRHEGRRPQLSVRGAENPGPRLPVTRDELEPPHAEMSHIRHTYPLTKNVSDTESGAHRISMASPKE